jgi:hypothetical protein
VGQSKNHIRLRETCSSRSVFTAIQAHTRIPTMTDRVVTSNDTCHFRARAAIAWILLLTCSHALASLQDENLLQPLPKGFKIANEQTEGHASLTEMVPVNESVDQWTRMVTTQVYRGLSDASFFARYKDQMKDRWSKACDVADTKPFSDGSENGYATHLWLQVCAFKDKQKKPEVTLFKFIQGRDATYVVQMAFHFQPAKSQLAESMAYLSKVTVCDTRRTESPCPVVESSNVTVKGVPESAK